MISLIKFFNVFFISYQKIDIRCFGYEIDIKGDNYSTLEYYSIENKKIFNIIYYIGEKLVYVE